MMRDTLTPHTQTNLSAPSPTVLDIYVVWHPKDKCGRDVFDRLVNHYHSEHFSGLAGSAIGPVRKLLTVCLCGCCPGRLV